MRMLNFCVETVRAPSRFYRKIACWKRRCEHRLCVLILVLMEKGLLEKTVRAPSLRFVLILVLMEDGLIIKKQKRIQFLGCVAALL